MKVAIEQLLNYVIETSMPAENAALMFMESEYKAHGPKYIISQHPKAGQKSARRSRRLVDTDRTTGCRTTCMSITDFTFSCLCIGILQVSIVSSQLRPCHRAAHHRTDECNLSPTL